MLLHAAFWCSLLVLFFTYFGYPLLLILLAPFWRRSPAAATAAIEPAVSIIVPVRDESSHAESKLRNCAQIDYPPEKTEILVIDDGSADDTLERVEAARQEVGKNGRRLRVISLGNRLGKAAAVNRGAREAGGEILVFSDADTLVSSASVRSLVAPFADPSVGCVAGRYVPGGARGRNAGGLGLYWRYENFLRLKESQMGGLLGASGALYAVRKRLYVPLDANLINDDFVVPMNVTAQGYRSVYEPSAEAIEDASQTELEFSRRVRIMAGNCQHLWMFRHLALRPSQWRTAFLLFCHKFLRVISPFWMAGLAASNAALLAAESSPEWLRFLYRGAFGLQVLFYTLALAGCLTRKRKSPASRLVALPYYFAMIHVAALWGICRFFFRRAQVPWSAQPVHR
ncbi:MAG TPA: glycosyltransferase family 2 protein [Sumerlaeia bacterium]|nr:glycosyltransferase family 2 protein [Sumerlaeia bacterium]